MTTTQRKRKKEWFDNEEFWRETYPFMFPAKRFDDTPQEIGNVLALAKPAGKLVLDLGCGPGRCSVDLAERGFSVTGVDRTRYMLNKARARARRAGVRVEWVLSDMRDFGRCDAFDLAISMYTSFGYFDDKKEDRLVLRNIFDSLRPGGVLLIETMGKERLARIFLETSSEMLSDGSLMVERHVVFDDWTRIRNEWILIRNEKTRRFSFHHTIYSGQELRDRMEEAGFEEVALYGDLSGDPYGRESTRLIALGWKP